MKRRLISAALIFALVLVLPGMGTRANPGDSGNEEEAEEDSDTDALEQKRKDTLKQIESIKSDISTVENQIKDLKQNKSNLQAYISKLDKEANVLAAQIQKLNEDIEAKKEEWKEYCAAVSSWEIDRYLVNI